MSDTPDNFAGEAERHPGSLVISLSHRKRQRADRLPRRKLSKEKSEEKERRIFPPNTSRDVRVINICLGSFLLDPMLDSLLDRFILNFFELSRLFSRDFTTLFYTILYFRKRETLLFFSLLICITVEPQFSIRRERYEAARHEISR